MCMEKQRALRRGKPRRTASSITWVRAGVSLVSRGPWGDASPRRTCQLHHLSSRALMFGLVNLVSLVESLWGCLAHAPSSSRWPPSPFTTSATPTYTHTPHSWGRLALAQSRRQANSVPRHNCQFRFRFSLATVVSLQADSVPRHNCQG